MARSVFISYRHQDSQAAAGRLHDQLSRHFRRDRLFLDVDGLSPGVDFVATLQEKVGACDALIAVIGPRWAEARDDSGARRLEDPHDFVRIELETALERGIPLIPALVDGAELPKADDLPESLRPLLRRQAVRLDHKSFARDVDDLAGALGASRQPSAAFAQSQSQRRRRSVLGAAFSFRGRLGRLGFWATVAAAIAFIALSAGLGQALEMTEPAGAAFVGAVIALWPFLAAVAKRARDFSLSAWVPFALFALSIVPVFIGISVVILIVMPSLTILFLGFAPGDPADNRFGAPPRL